MNQLVPLLLALLLCGCGRTPPPAVTLSDAQRADYSRMNIDTHAVWMNAISDQTNRAAILARYDAELNQAVVELLADTHSRGALIALQDSLARGKNRHTYTQQQLEAALELKEARSRK